MSRPENHAGMTACRRRRWGVRRDHLQRQAGVELLSYGVGPSAGQLRSGVVASLVSTRFSLVSGGS
jgi:hypothetical protein